MADVDAGEDSGTGTARLAVCSSNKHVTSNTHIAHDPTKTNTQKNKASAQSAQQVHTKHRNKKQNSTHLSTPASCASAPNIPLILSYWLLNNRTASLPCPSLASKLTIPARRAFKFRAICGRCRDVEPGRRWRSRRRERVCVDWEVSLARDAMVGLCGGVDNRYV